MGEKKGAGGGGDDKAELRRQMEEARESISETVAEIKAVVSHEYEEVREKVETVKEGVSEVLDWREQFERNPVVWGAGAVSVGILIGIGLANVFDEDDPAGGGRRKSKQRGPGSHILSELTGLADAVMPTISGKIKELFGLDLGEYLRTERERRSRAARTLASAPKRGAGKGAAKKRGTGKKGSGRKGPAGKKQGAGKRGARARKAPARA
ncbi:MAG TPA: hypothetical protein VD968_06195 [Pyrinomonadaceae bacterium]|nr:hypothetical protein [Pyrinomonadaceae bacterium]